MARNMWPFMSHWKWPMLFFPTWKEKKSGLDPPGLWTLLCKCADTLSSSSLPLNIFAFSSIPDFHRPLLLRFFSFPPQPALFLSAPHAQPGSRALMHHGTFYSSESQCDQALRSDRTATSLSITTHRRSAVPGPVWGKDAGSGWV